MYRDNGPMSWTVPQSCGFSLSMKPKRKSKTKTKRSSALNQDSSGFVHPSAKKIRRRRRKRGVRTEKQLSPEELAELARHYATTTNSEEAAEIKERIMEGFYGSKQKVLGRRPQNETGTAIWTAKAAGAPLPPPKGSAVFRQR